jgi:hypothetical protein
MVSRLLYCQLAISYYLHPHLYDVSDSKLTLYASQNVCLKRHLYIYDRREYDLSESSSSATEVLQAFT